MSLITKILIPVTLCFSQVTMAALEQEMKATGASFDKVANFLPMNTPLNIGK